MNVDSLFADWHKNGLPNATLVRALSEPVEVAGRVVIQTIFELRAEVADVEAAWPASDAYIGLPLMLGSRMESWMRAYSFSQGAAWFVITQSAGRAIIDGRFYSSKDACAMLAVAEHLACEVMTTARERIIDQCVRLLTPIASGQTAAELGARLGAKLPPAFAERFADAFGPALLGNALPRREPPATLDDGNGNGAI